MQEKSGSTRNWVYVALGIVAFAVFYLIKSVKMKDVVRLAVSKQDIFLSMLDKGNVSPRILSRTGKIVSRKFDAGKPGPKEDSLTFRLVLKGEKATATIRTKVMKQPDGKWQMVKSDTTFTE
ncbi:hypothetical protein [Hymenobacter wooponensis]|uniref:Uncharacterized protein n=1 Tax=Hymenobacter wooponensis TaxID=1525360 RepID=A0A4Z0MRB2_9BACT|nr:hypothetical protein [Hymenobacter wooponensis]TGD81806.1 hypothetical protein EU557_09740 [Hymenobacter wooponensis]